MAGLVIPAHAQAALKRQASYYSKALSALESHTSSNSSAHSPTCTGEHVHKPTLVRWQGRTLDVVTQHLAVTLGAALAQAFAALAAPGHGGGTGCLDRVVEVKEAAGLCGSAA